MEYFDFDAAFAEQALKCGDYNELALVVANMADTLSCWQKQLNDYASTLDD